MTFQIHNQFLTGTSSPPLYNALLFLLLVTRKIKDRDIPVIEGAILKLYTVTLYSRQVLRLFKTLMKENQKSNVLSSTSPIVNLNPLKFIK